MPSNTTVVISGIDLVVSEAGKSKENVLALASFLNGAVSGAKRVDTVDVYANAPGAASKASATITMATSSGPVGATINGVTILVVWAVSDAASSTALASAINGSTNPLVQGIVTASASGAVTTISSVQKNILANAITLAASGINVTASSTRLVGGAGGNTTNAITNFL